MDALSLFLTFWLLSQVISGAKISGAKITATVPQASGILLASLIANNTSACGNPFRPGCSAPFTGMSDTLHPGLLQTPIPNPPPGNVSTIDVHTLAPAGVTICAHFMLWFKSPWTGDHSQSKYTSNSTATVNAQVNDMSQRGVDCVISDWYSSLSTGQDQTQQKLAANLDARCSGLNCPMHYAIMEDQGAITHSGDHNCALTNHSCVVSAWETDLCYMNKMYFGSPSYLRLDPTTHLQSNSGRVAIYTFPPPSPGWAVADMTSIRAFAQNLAANCPAGSNANNGPVLISNQDNSGYSGPYDGSFFWVGSVKWDTTVDCRSPNPNAAPLVGSQYCWDRESGAYLRDLYSSGNSHPTRITTGSAAKGFDDAGASWHPNPNRVVAQECGTTWLKKWTRAQASTTVTLIQLATWNDYEEGSELETGIGQCYFYSTVNLSGSIFSWTLGTSDSTFASTSSTNGTIDHFQIYCGLVSDPTHVSLVQDNISASASSVDLSGLGISSGSHNCYSRLISKPFIMNALSSGVLYTN